MSRRTKLLGTLGVSNALILSYIAQISHVSATAIAQWTLHDWVAAILLVLYAGITNWIGFLLHPNAVLTQSTITSSSSAPAPAAVVTSQTTEPLSK